MSIRNIAQFTFYVILFLFTSSALVSTLIEYPLFPIDNESLDWSNAWLLNTVFDYYGACLCFCGVVLSSESNKVVGVVWVIGCCLLGSPVCCMWVLLRLWNGGSLKLESNHRHGGSTHAEYANI